MNPMEVSKLGGHWSFGILAKQSFHQLQWSIENENCFVKLSCLFEAFGINLSK